MNRVVWNTVLVCTKKYSFKRVVPWKQISISSWFGERTNGLFIGSLAQNIVNLLWPTFVHVCKPIKYKYIDGVIQVSWLVYEKNMSDYWIKVNQKPTGFGGTCTCVG